MAATAKRSPSKTRFVQEVLTKNPHANARIVREAWAAAGFVGSISQTLINKQRNQMGLAGNIKGGRPKRSEMADDLGEPRERTGGRSASFSQLEADIDHMLFRVMSLGGLENIEEGLRRTRRLLYQAMSAAGS